MECVSLETSNSFDCGSLSKNEVPCATVQMFSVQCGNKTTIHPLASKILINLNATCSAVSLFPFANSESDKCNLIWMDVLRRSANSHRIGRCLFIHSHELAIDRQSPQANIVTSIIRTRVVTSHEYGVTSSSKSFIQFR